MAEFNSDGSLKLPTSVLKSKEENIQKMKTQQCIKVRREIVNFTAPKKCVLKITLSDAIKDSRFIETIYTQFKEKAATPTKLKKINDHEFEVEVGTDFKRCTDCTTLRNQYNEFLYGKLIDEKGNCTYEGRLISWSDEDYFE